MLNALGVIVKMYGSTKIFIARAKSSAGIPCENKLWFEGEAGVIRTVQQYGNEVTAGSQPCGVKRLVGRKYERGQKQTIFAALIVCAQLGVRKRFSNKTCEEGAYLRYSVHTEPPIFRFDVLWKHGEKSVEWRAPGREIL